MKNWKYVEGAKTGNGILDMLKSEKPIKMKSSKGAIVTIHPDGSAAHQEKEGSQMAVHRHNSFKEAVEYYKNHGYEKVGNDTPLEYAHRKPKVINDDKTGAEEFFKQLSDDVKEREDKDDADIEKVGNREIYVNQSEQTKAVVYEDGTIMLWDKNGNNYKTIKAGSLEEARKKLNSDYKKVGNANLETSVEKGKLGLWNWYVHKDGTIVSGGTSSTEANAKEMARKALEKEKAGNKVGNTSINELQEFLDGYGTGGSVSQMVSMAARKFGDFNILNDRYLVDKKSGETYQLIKSGSMGKYVAKQIGNSAQDDKFAYVMREFDEGKLKTPDGKVVTDPAQAKAIAYSESKKTENGLARARNAMACNKKVGNHDFEEGDYVLYNGKKAVVRGFNGSQEVIIEQNGQRITTHWSNLEEYE